VRSTLPPYASQPNVAQQPSAQSHRRSPSPYRGAMPSPAVHAAVPPSPNEGERQRSRSPVTVNYTHHTTHTSTQTRIRRNSHSHTPRPVVAQAHSYTPVQAPAPSQVRVSASSAALRPDGTWQTHTRDAERERQRQKERERGKLVKPPHKPHGAATSGPQTVHYSDGTHAHVHEDGFKYSTCTGRKRALCVRFPSPTCYGHERLTTATDRD
jgi:hypothetical protein